jgi:GDP-L-fucose synthase
LTRNEVVAAGQAFFAGRRVLVTGASGFIGQNLTPLLLESKADLICPSHADADLTIPSDVSRLFSEVRPEVVIHLAGLVGGILANRDEPATYAHQNLLMGTLPIHEAWRAGVSKYVTLIGGCSYPATAPSPIAESDLWNGYPQPESAPYSLAKRMAVVLAQAYRKEHGLNAVVLVPGNVYGPFDNFNLRRSHVIPALIRKFHEAREAGVGEVIAWGSGKPVRDFVYVEDACEAILLAAAQYNDPDIINISSGQETTIRELVETVSAVTGYSGRIAWDATKPDGQLKKGFDVTRMHERLRYDCRTTLRAGLERTFTWYEANIGSPALRI